MTTEDAPPGDAQTQAHSPAEFRDARERRISYFMLFRLGVLVVITIFAAIGAAQESNFGEHYGTLGWSTLVVAFGLTVIFARFLPRVDDLEAFAFVQSAVDIVLSAVVVQLTGGLDSSFVFLYLVAILGAALMGTRAQCWASTGACALIFSSMAGFQISGAIEPDYPLGIVPAQTTGEYVYALIRTLIAIAAVGTLATNLNTQLWRSDEQLASVRALNRYIVNSLGSGLVTIDAQQRISFANPQATDLLGAEPSQLEGQAAGDFFPGLEHHFDASAGRAPRFEITRAGRVLGCSLGPLRDGRGEILGWVLNFQDITEVRGVEAQLRRKERLAAVGGLAASVAHEVRNPLAAMAGSAELINQGQLEADDRRLLAIITREAARLERMVTDMLSFTRPRPLDFHDFDLARVLREAVEAFRADPANASIDLEFAAPQSLNAQVDRGSVTQLAWNLLRNASEATQRDGRVRVELSQEGGRARIVVADNGQGIAAADLEKIFEPFESGKLEGFGFGLALVQRIVKDHGGDIAVESTLNEGATFTVHLPLRRAPTASSTFAQPLA